MRKDAVVWGKIRRTGRSRWRSDRAEGGNPGYQKTAGQNWDAKPRGRSLKPRRAIVKMMIR